MPFALLAGATVLSAGIGAAGSLGAAGTSASAANRAADLQLAQYQQTRTDLSPYTTAGTTSLGALSTGLGTTGGALDLTSPLLASPLAGQGAAPVYNMPPFDESKYKASPGYKWELDQGLNAVTNSAVGKTGALSGNMLKALDLYGTGAASQDYWTAYNAYAKDYGNQYSSLYNNYWKTADYGQTQQANQFNRLFDITRLGENAAAGVGTAGASAATSAGTALQNAGNATASGTLGATNAASTGLNNLGTNYAALYGYGGYGGAAASPNAFYIPGTNSQLSSYTSSPSPFSL